MTVTLHYTEAIFRRAIAQYLLRCLYQQWLTLVLLALGAGLALFCESIWVEIILAFAFLFVPVMFALGYWLRVRESLRRFRQLNDGRVVFSVDDEGTRIESAIGKSESRWLIYEDLWEFPDCHLLFYSGAQFITLPRDQVPTEMISFIRIKLPRKNSGKAS